MDFVFRVIGHAVWHGYLEPKAYDRIASFQHTRAAVLGSRGRKPRVHPVIYEGVIEPFLDFVTQSVNIANVRDAIVPGVRPEDAIVTVRGEHIGVHLLLTIAVQ